MKSHNNKLFLNGFLQLAEDYSYPPVHQNSALPPTINIAPLNNQGSIDGADGWDDDWDDEGSSHNGDQETGTVASIPRRNTGSSAITRTGTVRKSMNRYTVPRTKLFFTSTTSL